MSQQKTARSGTHTIEDFYLTSINKQLNGSSRRFEAIKQNCMDNLMKQTNKSIVFNNSLSGEAFSNNLYSVLGVNLTPSSLPSYGNYTDTLPSSVAKTFKESTLMEKLFHSFDTSYYCLEEVSKA